MSVKPNNAQVASALNTKQEIIDLVGSKRGRLAILRNARWYLDAGVSLDFLQEVFDEYPLPNYEVAERLDDIVSVGIKVDVQRLAKSLTALQRIMHSGTLRSYGIDIDVDDELLNMLINEPTEVADHIKTIARCGANVDIELLVDVLMEQKQFHCIVRNLEVLVSRGADIDVAKLANLLRPVDRLVYRKTLEAYGAKISIRDCLRGLTGPEIADAVNKLGLVKEFMTA